MIEQNLYLSGHQRSRTSEALNELNHKQETGPQIDNLALSFTLVQMKLHALKIFFFLQKLPSNGATRLVFQSYSDT